MRRTGPTLTWVGPFLLVSSGRQTDKVTDPLARELASVMGAQTSPGQFDRLTIGKHVAALWSALRAYRLLRREVDDLGLPFPLALREEIFESALIGLRAERTFAARGPVVVVCASQHNSPTRAVLRAAHVCGHHTVYVPHAPVADTPWYTDLPVTLALVRGPSERDFYIGLGAPGERVESCGDPTTSYVDSNASPGSRLLLATRPAPQRELGLLVDLVAAAQPTDVVLAPHPRSNMSELRSLCPPSWEFNDSMSTYDRMRAGDIKAVVHDGSGTGLESLALGLPTIEIVDASRKRSRYLYGDDPSIDRVSNAHELAMAIREVDWTPSAVLRRREAAHSWLGPQGTAARARLVEHLLRLLDSPVPSTLTLDGWSPSFNLRER